MVFDLDVMRAKYRALGRGPRRRDDPLRGEGQPGARGGGGGGGARRARSTPPRAARSTSACRSACRRAHIAFGNTIKRAADIAHAHAMGVEQFAADAEEEIRKIAAHAPGARVIIRMLVEASEADWPLSRKFGCSPREALRLMDLGRFLGLDVAGISFHAGSQMREPRDVGAGARRRAGALGRGGRARAMRLRILNIGGGFPAFYGQPLPATARLCRRGDAHGAPPLRRRGRR